MISFEFSQSIVEKILVELSSAQKYIRIAIFQIHREEVIDVLSKKLDEGVKVEIFTLPYDSINEDVRERVSRQLDAIEKKGAIIYKCKWNVGDPERTSTAVGRWYSFHGKFIVTEQAAISLSANFTDNNELDATLIYKNEEDKINEFNQQFDKLLKLFIQDEISTKIKKVFPDNEALFELPQGIDKLHDGYWIKDYPLEICPDLKSYKDKLYISPFDVRGRSIVYEILEEAQEFIYISIESFTDPDILHSLIQAKLRNVEIKLLTGGTSMDFTNRVQKMLRVLLGAGVSIRRTQEALHAKLLITEKRVVVSSINFNKMNLGFKKAKLWRQNTETITLLSDRNILLEARKQYDTVFNSGIDISISLSQKLEKEVTALFSKYYKLRSRAEVKKLFSRFILSREVDVHKITLKIGKTIKILLDKDNRKMIRKDDFLMALILYFLSENKLTYDQLEKSLFVLDSSANLKSLLSTLISHQYIEQENSYYKLDVSSLLEGGLQ